MFYMDVLCIILLSAWYGTSEYNARLGKPSVVERASTVLLYTHVYIYIIIIYAPSKVTEKLIIIAMEMIKIIIIIMCEPESLGLARVHI